MTQLNGKFKKLRRQQILNNFDAMQKAPIQTNIFNNVLSELWK